MESGSWRPPFCNPTIDPCMLLKLKGFVNNIDSFSVAGTAHREGTEVKSLFFSLRQGPFYKKKYWGMKSSDNRLAEQSGPPLPQHCKGLGLTPGHQRDKALLSQQRDALTSEARRDFWRPKKTSRQSQSSAVAFKGFTLAQGVAESGLREISKDNFLIPPPPWARGWECGDFFIIIKKPFIADIIKVILLLHGL